MKKIIYLALVFSGVSLASCKKNYTCTCAVSSQGTNPVYTTTTATIHDTKSNATSKCNGTEVMSGTTQNCTLNY